MIKDPQIVSFGRGSDDKKIKEEDRAIDLEEKPLPPTEVYPGTKSNRVVKQYSQGGNISVKAEQDTLKTNIAMSKKEYPLR